MSNEDDKPKSLDEIMDEIEAEEEALIAPPSPDPSDEGEKSTAVVRSSADDIEDRRKKSWELRQRGMTYREIGEETGVSIATVKKDLDFAKEKYRTEISSLEKEEYLASAIPQYDDIISTAWKIAKSSPTEDRLRALDLIRKTVNDKRKAIQDVGVIKKENKVVEHTISILDEWSEENKQQAVQALIGMNMPTLGEPTPDIEEAEIVEEVVKDGESDS